MQFSKYSASGNDFVIFHTFIEKDRTNLAKKLCDRHSGIGADGLIVILPGKNNEYDFKWQFYNNDGSVANMCGNGSRAVAHYAYNNGLCNNKMKFLTGAGIIEANVTENIVESTLTETKIFDESFEEEGLNWSFYDTGVPHLVTFVSDLNLYNQNIAKKMRDKYNANVNFAKIKDDKIFVRTYERGVEDETLACGTGMCASFLKAKELGLVGEKVTVIPKSGEKLEISLKNNRLYFKGRVLHTFDACYKL